MVDVRPAMVDVRPAMVDVRPAMLGALRYAGRVRKDFAESARAPSSSSTLVDMATLKQLNYTTILDATPSRRL